MDRFQLLKRKLYLWLIPILLLALANNFFYWDSITLRSKIVITFLLIFFTFGWIILYKKWKLILVERVVLFVICSIHLLNSYGMLQLMVTEGAFDSTETFIWAPLTYIFICVSLTGRAGALLALFIWALTLGINLLFINDIPSFKYALFSQYHLANLVYIIIMFSARHILTSYAEMDTLKKLAYIDQLTGIHNRGSIFASLEQMTEAAQKNHTPLSIIFFDIDYFKKINDRFGHQIGDSVLIDITNIVKDQLPKTTSFGRWGGEEFIILLPNTTVSESLSIAEKIRLAIEQHNFIEGYQVTSSFGLESFQTNDTVDSLLERVDQALYVAKESGRNQVNVYSV
ncbi:GGDEF domain-containing protein [Bacillus alkalicellulosilyticus]|uniref:GGDEF domain-containing protein n=1 Tax=Alkalihalobacterium alkalicellulosilyticum TaxID=1912214 RepID=UPI00099858AE|nr:GGDEF domain-containing protein [Bacillus alkalicellulosilyticus]